MNEHSTVHAVSVAGCGLLLMSAVGCGAPDVAGTWEGTSDGAVPVSLEVRQEPDGVVQGSFCPARLDAVEQLDDCHSFQGRFDEGVLSFGYVFTEPGGVHEVAAELILQDDDFLDGSYRSTKCECDVPLFFVRR